MTPDQITDLIKKRGANYSAIARSIGVSHTSVRRVVFGLSKSRPVARTIAIFLGRSVDELWPGMYPDVYKRKGPDEVTRAQLAAAARAAQREAA
jgi:lambda repressor-like predicted transcriptional regulator